MRRKKSTLTTPVRFAKEIILGLQIEQRAPVEGGGKRQHLSAVRWRNRAESAVRAPKEGVEHGLVLGRVHKHVVHTVAHGLEVRLARLVLSADRNCRPGSPPPW